MIVDRVGPLAFASAGDRVDTAVAAFCLYHAAEPAHVVREIARCLRPSGTVVLATQSADSYPRNRRRHRPRRESTLMPTTRRASIRRLTARTYRPSSATSFTFAKLSTTHTNSASPTSTTWPLH
ncbi:methyltransferase domain-containing protein [Fodinicola acaciae]|uniref:methyltransferase domain-containing protein n=1 Tax=Fodinicola acaciae TaxID=2681555 RepID=UPI0013D2E968